jgi:hypothetical protein
MTRHYTLALGASNPYYEVMATNLIKFPEPTGRSQRHYPWDTWFDGQIWQLEQGTDFPGNTRSFMSNARNVARGRGLTLRMMREGETLTLQATGRRKP